MSQDRNHLNHATWECKYHVVFTPKYREASVSANQAAPGDCISRACQAQGMQVEEGHLMPDHVHILISIRQNIQWRR